MTTALKEIHIENSKKRDASVRFVSLIREKDPKPAYKGKTIKISASDMKTINRNTQGVRLQDMSGDEMISAISSERTED